MYFMKSVPGVMTIGSQSLLFAPARRVDETATEIADGEVEVEEAR